VGTESGSRIVARVFGAAGLALALALSSASCGRAANAGSVEDPAPRPAPRSVSFPTDDGGSVDADEYGAGERAVVLAHGARFQKGSWAKEAAAFAKGGLRVLAIDFRGYGRSKPGTSPPGSEEGLALDVLAAVRYLRASGAKRVSVVGGSMGGGAAAQAAVECRPVEIDGLVLLAHSPIAHPEKLQGRKLFVVARDDTDGSGHRRLDRIREQYDKAPDPKQLLVLDGSAHAQFLFATDQGPQLTSEILRFLNEP